MSQKKSKLFLQQDGQRLRFTEAVLAGGVAKIVKAADITLAGEGDGQRIRDELSGAGISLKDVMVVLPRRDASLKLLPVPDLSDDELNSIVPLQGERRLGRPLDDLYFDHLSASPPVHGERHAVFVTVPQQRLNNLITALRDAGLNTNSAMITEFSLRAGCPGEQLVADLILREQQSELILTLGDMPVAAMTLRLPDDELAASMIASTVQRMHAGLPVTLAEKTIVELKVHPVGRRDLDLASLQAALSGVSVSIGEYRSENDLLSLLLQAPKNRNRRLDLLQPRNMHASTLSRYQKPIRVAAILLGGAMIFGLWLWQEHARLDQKLAELENQNREVTQLVDHGAVILESEAVVSGWQQDNVDWSEEIARFSEHLPGTDRIYLTRLQVDVSPTNGEATLRVSGMARTSEDVTTLNSRLVSLPDHYEMHPATIQPSSRDPYFQAMFDLEAKLKRSDELALPQPEEI